MNGPGRISAFGLEPIITKEALGEILRCAQNDNWAR